ncbi:CvpA family protein [Helicobacter pametensis]|uniref:CvpA family protein n=1 Tax=Helicobacter pametensis TaxID=95149 RepID=UPI000487EC39|nr:CvpA family protein [Helicobacter pametensis]
MDNLGYIDFIILGIMAFIAFRGFFSGFMRELLGMLGLVLGVVFASRYSYEAGDWFRAHVFDLGSGTLHTFVGFLIIFLAIWISSLLLAELISRIATTAFSKYINRILGAFFGALKAFLAIAIVLHLALSLEFMSGVLRHVGNHSQMYPLMEGIASKLVKIDVGAYIPQDTNEAQQKLDHTKNKVIDETKALEEKIEQSVSNPQEIIKGQ